MSPEPIRPRLGAAVHGALIALLIALRPLVWDEDASGIPALAYLVLIAVALAIVLGESWAGARRRWRWSTAGLLFAALALTLIPAALRSPLPAQGGALWLTVASQVGLAAYLMQAVPGRERVALAALGAGLFGESLVAVLQWPWVLPAMARAQQEGRLAGVVSSDLQGDLAERIANGGLYGTFTLANGLAAYLLLAAPPLVASGLFAAFGWWRRRGEGAQTPFAGFATAIVLTLTLMLAGAAFLGTKSKGAYLALAAAMVAWWWWRQRRLNRWYPIVIVSLLALRVCLSQAHTYVEMRHGLHASAEVRIGYWQAAAQLVRQHPLAGSGLRAFGEDSPRALPIWAEFSTHAHNEPLEVAVEAGLPVALLLVVLLAVAARPRPVAMESAPPEEPSHAVPWVLGLGVLYFAVLGLFDANLGWWPGGGDALGTVGWSAVLAAAIAMVYAALLRLPPAPGWAYALGLGALALHSLVDFDLRSGAVVGTAAACAVLAPGIPRTLGESARRLPIPALALATLASVTYVALVIAACVQGYRLRDARAIADGIEALRSQGAHSRDEAQELLAGIAARSGQAEPPADALDRPQAMRDILVAAFVRAEGLAAPDYELRTRLISLAPPGAQREEFTARLAALRPASAVAQGLWSQDERVIAITSERAGDAAAAANHWHQALERMRRSCDFAPLTLRARAAYAALLDEAAQHLPLEAEALKKEAEQERGKARELNGKVNPRYRL